MKLFEKAKWISTDCPTGDSVPEYWKSWDCSREISSAALMITALGVYEAELNGRRVGQFVLAPGWASYENRLQVQRYDVTTLLREHNTLAL